MNSRTGYRLLLLASLFLIRKSPGFARYGTPSVSTGVILVSGYRLLGWAVFSG
jgi:hypothetical protein